MARSSRERTLGLVAGLIAGGVALFWVGGKVLAPFRNLRADIREKSEELKELENRKALTEHALARYAAWCEQVPFDPDQPLDDVARTAAHLREQITEVLALDGIAGRVNVTKWGEVRNESFKPKRKAKKKDLIPVVSIDLQGAGDVEAMLQFILELYRRNELIHVSTATVEPARRRDLGEEPAEREPIRFTGLKIETLVVERDEDVIETVKESKSLDSPRGRLAHDSEAYAALTAWRPFDEIMPPKPPPPPVDETVEVTTRPVRTPPPPPPAPPRDRDWLVKGFTRGVVDEVLVVRIQQHQPRRGGRRRGRAAPEPEGDAKQYKRVGDEFDAGTLEFVHRLGAVVRRTEDDAAEDDPGQLWLYPYGTPFEECILLDEADTYREVQLAVMAMNVGPELPESRQDDTVGEPR